MKEKGESQFFYSTGRRRMLWSCYGKTAQSFCITRIRDPSRNRSFRFPLTNQLLERSLPHTITSKNNRITCLCKKMKWLLGFTIPLMTLISTLIFAPIFFIQLLVLLPLPLRPPQPQPRLRFVPLA